MSHILFVLTLLVDFVIVIDSCRPTPTGRLEHFRLQSLIAKKTNTLWFTGDTAGTKWWMNATDTEHKYQYYPPRGQHMLCVPIPDGYFDEHERKKISQDEKNRGTKHWKRAKSKLKTLNAFKKRRKSSLKTNVVNETFVDTVSGRRYSVDNVTGESVWEAEEQNGVVGMDEIELSVVTVSNTTDGTTVATK